MCILQYNVLAHVKNEKLFSFSDIDSSSITKQLFILYNSDCSQFIRHSILMLRVRMQ